MSRERLDEHRRLWALKAVLADVYEVWFEAILAEVPPGSRVLEAGAGPGFLADHARRRRPDAHWLATDILEVPWNDVVADGQCLPFHDRSFDVLAGIDILHHLCRPLAFLAEASRVVRVGGRIALVEPWVTWFSYPIYRWLHQEGCTPTIDPRAPFDSTRGKEAFDGDAAIPWRLVDTTPAAEWRTLGLAPPSVVPVNGFAYLLSLGFRPASLLPRSLVPLLLALDRSASGLAPHLGLRALVVWQRLAAISSPPA